MKKKLLVHLIVGFVLGVAIGLGIAWLETLSSGGRLMEHSFIAERVGLGGAITLQTLLSGVLGCVSVTGMLLYEIDKWSLAKATVVHYVAIIAAFSLASFSLGWFVSAIAYYFVAVACNTVGFFIIWLIMYLLWKKEVKKMNEELSSYKEEQAKSNEEQNEK